MYTDQPVAKKILFLINPGAGKGVTKEIKVLVSSRFKEPEWSVIFGELASWREIQPSARAAAFAGAWAVVAVGGDGTLNQVAQALEGTACRLGLIPTGTGNGFARALGIPLDMPGACDVIDSGLTARIDFVNADSNRGYANLLGIGYDAWVADAANKLRWMNRYSGFLRYFVAGIRCLPMLRTQAIRLTIDELQVVEGRFFMVAVANSPQYGLGCTISPQSKLDSGSIDVVCLQSMGLWIFLRNFLRLFTKKPLLGAVFYRCQQVQIESLENWELAVHMDGEPGGSTPVQVRVKPGALIALVPENFCI